MITVYTSSLGALTLTLQGNLNGHAMALPGGGAGSAPTHLYASVVICLEQMDLSHWSSHGYVGGGLQFHFYINGI